jgi:hypothetical protein
LVVFTVVGWVWWHAWLVVWLWVVTASCISMWESYFFQNMWKNHAIWNWIEFFLACIPCKYNQKKRPV